MTFTIKYKICIHSTRINSRDLAILHTKFPFINWQHCTRIIMPHQTSHVKNWIAITPLAPIANLYECFPWSFSDVIVKIYHVHAMQGSSQHILTPYKIMHSRIHHILNTSRKAYQYLKNCWDITRHVCTYFNVFLTPIPNMMMKLHNVDIFSKFSAEVCIWIAWKELIWIGILPCPL